MPGPPSGSVTIGGCGTLLTELTELEGKIGALGDPQCVENPECKDCSNTSPESFAVAGPGPIEITPAFCTLKVEERLWHLPPGSTIGDSWCEVNPLCCTGSGDGLGCCPDPLPGTLHINLITGVGPCGGNTNITWNGTAWIGSLLSGANTIDITLTPPVSGCNYELALTCDGHTITATAAPSCGPPVSFAFLMPSTGTSCCDGVEADIVDSAGSGGGVGGLSLTVRYTEILIPDYSQIAKFCIEPDCDPLCPPTVTCTSCVGDLPCRLWAVISNFRFRSGSDNVHCDFADPIVMPLECQFDIFGQFTGWCGFYLHARVGNGDHNVYCLFFISVQCAEGGLFAVISYGDWSVPIGNDTWAGLPMPVAIAGCDSPIGSSANEQGGVFRTFDCVRPIFHEETNIQVADVANPACCDDFLFDCVITE